MPQPDLNSIIAGWWGGTFDPSGLAGVLGGASNVIVGSNPAYGISDFLAIYPKFGTLSGAIPPIFNGPLPQVVLQMYITLASASLAAARWLDLWPMAMALYVAHYATLYLRSEGDVGSTAGSIASSGLAKGVLISKGAGGVSAGVNPFGDENFGAWNLTSYGQQLIPLAKCIGGGMMVIV